jgi:hypothetical protein
MFEQAFKNIDGVLWKEAGCTTELDYTEQTSWLLFLNYLDGLKEDKAAEAGLDGKRYTYILEKAYRWDLGRPKGKDGKLDEDKKLSPDEDSAQEKQASPGKKMICLNARTFNSFSNRPLTLRRVFQLSVA